MDTAHVLAIAESLRVAATIKALRVSTAQMERELQDAKEAVRKVRRLRAAVAEGPYRRFLAGGGPDGITPRRCCARSRRVQQVAARLPPTQTAGLAFRADARTRRYLACTARRGRCR